MIATRTGLPILVYQILSVLVNTNAELPLCLPLSRTAISCTSVRWRAARSQPLLDYNSPTCLLSLASPNQHYLSTSLPTTASSLRPKFSSMCAARPPSTPRRCLNMANKRMRIDESVQQIPIPGSTSTHHQPSIGRK
jgi:hypothetical protein